MTKNLEIKAVIFDIDDLLFRSESLAKEAMILAAAKKGIIISPQEYVEYWILKKKTIVDYVEEFDHDVNPIEIRKEYLRLLEKMGHRVELMPGAKNLIKKLYGKKKLAVGSGNWRRIIDKFLQKHKMNKHFDAVVALDDVKKGKPDPETFLSVAKILEVQPEECVVLEDTISGIKAAKNAGMRAIAVPGPNSKKDDFSSADMVFKSLNEISLESIDSLTKKE